MAASKDRRTAAARKRASVKAQERTRRTVRTPGKVKESGSAGYAAASVLRGMGKHLSAQGRAARREMNQVLRGEKKASEKVVKASQNKPKSFSFSTGKPAPTKPSARSTSAKYRGKKKK